MVGIFKTVLRCKLCRKEFDDGVGSKDHFRYHILKGDTFSAPCKLDGDPFHGVCTNERIYKDCLADPDMKSNEMCWRNGILIEFHKPR